MLHFLYISTRFTQRKRSSTIKLSDPSRKKKIITRVVAIAVVVVLLTAATIGLVIMIKALKAGKKVSFLSDIKDLKDSYYVGDEVEAGGTFRATYADGHVEIITITEDMIEGFDSSEPGLIAERTINKTANGILSKGNKRP